MTGTFAYTVGILQELSGAFWGTDSYVYRGYSEYETNKHLAHFSAGASNSIYQDNGKISQLSLTLNYVIKA